HHNPVAGQEHVIGRRQNELVSKGVFGAIARPNTPVPPRRRQIRKQRRDGRNTRRRFCREHPASRPNFVRTECAKVKGGTDLVGEGP
ncbi:MAG TPA: hypothetical protein VE734_09275, partial [Terriglobales bacterium]|nr:hypothetical protein [Terriglobales bacterium]